MGPRMLEISRALIHYFSSLETTHDAGYINGATVMNIALHIEISTVTNTPTIYHIEGLICQYEN